MINFLVGFVTGYLTGVPSGFFSNLLYDRWKRRRMAPGSLSTYSTPEYLFFEGKVTRKVDVGEVFEELSKQTTFTSDISKLHKEVIIEELQSREGSQVTTPISHTITSTSSQDINH